MKFKPFNQMKGVEFETFAYHIDYMVNGKYVGSITVDAPDREILGYNGRLRYALDSDVEVRKNGGRMITIKAGTNVVTECFPLNGRQIKFNEYSRPN